MEGWTLQMDEMTWVDDGGVQYRMDTKKGDGLRMDG